MLALTGSTQKARRLVRNGHFFSHCPQGVIYLDVANTVTTGPLVMIYTWNLVLWAGRRVPRLILVL